MCYDPLSEFAQIFWSWKFRSSGRTLLVYQFSRQFGRTARMNWVLGYVSWSSFSSILVLGYLVSRRMRHDRIWLFWILIISKFIITSTTKKCRRTRCLPVLIKKIFFFYLFFLLIFLFNFSNTENHFKSLILEII